MLSPSDPSEKLGQRKCSYGLYVTFSSSIIIVNGKGTQCGAPRKNLASGNHCRLNALKEPSLTSS